MNVILNISTLLWNILGDRELFAFMIPISILSNSERI